MPTSLTYIVLSTRGCSPWRPAADRGTARHENHTVSLGFSRADGGAPDTARDAVLYGRKVPYLRTSRFQGGVRSLQRRENSSRDPRRRLRVRLRCRTGLAADRREPGQRDDLRVGFGNVNPTPFRWVVGVCVYRYIYAAAVIVQSAIATESAQSSPIS